MNFEDVVVIITGASKGIGRCLANILSKYGANVIGVYNSTKIKNVDLLKEPNSFSELGSCLWG